MKEANLVRRAIKERWPIPEAERADVVARLLQTVREAEDARSVVAAARAIIAADALNMEQEKRDQQIPEYHVHEVRVRAEEMTDDDLAAIAHGGRNGTAPPPNGTH